MAEKLYKVEESKKQKKVAEAPKQKRRFIIEVDGVVPVKVRFQTFAFDENEALKQLDNPQLISILDRPQLDLPRLSRKNIRVKDALTSLVKLVKSF